MQSRSADLESGVIRKVGCSTYNYCEGMEPSESVHLYRVGSYTDKSVCVSMYYINQLILYIFTAEVIIKVRSVCPSRKENQNPFEPCLCQYIAEGFSPWCYHYSGWNNFDCIIVILSYALSSQRAMMPLLRILRLFRVLKLLKAFPELAVIINAFISAFASIGYIGLLLVLTFYVSSPKSSFRSIVGLLSLSPGSSPDICDHRHDVISNK